MPPHVRLVRCRSSISTGQMQVVDSSVSLQPNRLSWSSPGTGIPALSYKKCSGVSVRIRPEATPSGIVRTPSTPTPLVVVEGLGETGDGVAGFGLDGDVGLGTDCGGGPEPLDVVGRGPGRGRGLPSDGDGARSPRGAGLSGWGTSLASSGCPVRTFAAISTVSTVALRRSIQTRHPFSPVGSNMFTGSFPT